MVLYIPKYELPEDLKNLDEGEVLSVFPKLFTSL